MSKSNSPEQLKGDPAVHPDEKQDLYKFELQRYRTALKRNLDQAYKRYGFTLFQSLEPMERILWLHEIGFVPVDEIDFYNLGTVAVAQENYQQAKEWFKKALKVRPDMPEATFNLALCYERLANVQKAIELWQEYVKLLDPARGEEIETVKNHIATLKKEAK
jgi:tetratricopeptide (TPR) repeat protein